MNKKVTDLLVRMTSTAEGLSGVLWIAKYHAGDKKKLKESIKTMQLQLDSLQSDLNKLSK